MYKFSHPQSPAHSLLQPIRNSISQIPPISQCQNEPGFLSIVNKTSWTWLTCASLFCILTQTLLPVLSNLQLIINRLSEWVINLKNKVSRMGFSNRCHIRTTFCSLKKRNLKIFFYYKVPFDNGMFKVISETITTIKDLFVFIKIQKSIYTSIWTNKKSFK